MQTSERSYRYSRKAFEEGIGLASAAETASELDLQLAFGLHELVRALQADLRAVNERLDLLLEGDRGSVVGLCPVGRNPLSRDGKELRVL